MQSDLFLLASGVVFCRPIERLTSLRNFRIFFTFQTWESPTIFHSVNIQHTRLCQSHEPRLFFPVIGGIATEVPYVTKVCFNLSEKLHGL